MDLKIAPQLEGVAPQFLKVRGSFAPQEKIENSRTVDNH